MLRGLVIGIAAVLGMMAETYRGEDRQSVWLAGIFVIVFLSVMWKAEE